MRVFIPIYLALRIIYPVSDTTLPPNCAFNMCSAALERILTTPLPLYVFLFLFVCRRLDAHLSLIHTAHQCLFCSHQVKFALATFFGCADNLMIFLRQDSECLNFTLAVWANILFASSTVWIYLFFLPFQLIDQFAWSTIPGVGIASFIYLGLISMLYFCAIRY